MAELNKRVRYGSQSDPQSPVLDYLGGKVRDSVNPQIGLPLRAGCPG
jgi:hypothetical protein